MYNGWTESEAQITARTRRRNAQHLAAESAPTTAQPGRVILPPMSETEWWGMPAAVRHFHPLERATQHLEIVTQEGGN